MSQKEDAEFLKTCLREFQEMYKLFWHLSPCDFVEPEVPSRKQQIKMLIGYSAHLNRLAKDAKSVLRASCLRKFAKLLLEDSDFRSRRADELIARRKRIIECRNEKHLAKVERLARLAEYNGFDGNLYRDLIPSDNPLSLQEARRLEKKIETIPKIIAAIEKPVERSAIPDGAELLTVPQVSRLLGWGESVVRERDKKGLLPLPIRIGGAIQWRKAELVEWLAARAPTREQWLLLKQRKAVE